MTININEELANVDARLKEIEPIVLSTQLVLSIIFPSIFSGVLFI